MRLHKELSAVSTTLLLFVVGIVLFYDDMPRLEGWLLPVVTEVETSQEASIAAGVRFYVTFEKVRDCEFISLIWYNGPDRLVLDFEPSAESAPISRTPGGQATGPWLLSGIETLEGTTATVVHQCHPLWYTRSVFFPLKAQ